ncbi:hypothetical protein [Bacillus salacetis]|uniref:hypothetical protein n=1 Tax=Bacillus salacetis TaxID=2315464 RepID=UPI001443A3B5|nr:hypothetical protein [Bacillus salacetis]
MKSTRKFAAYRSSVLVDGSSRYMIRSHLYSLIIINEQMRSWVEPRETNLANLVPSFIEGAGFFYFLKKPPSLDKTY